MKQRKFHVPLKIIIGGILIPILLLIAFAVNFVSLTNSELPKNDFGFTPKNIEPAKALIPTEPVKNQVTVSFKADATDEEKQAYLDSIGAKVVSQINALNSYTVEVNDDVASNLPTSDQVAQSEPDYQVGLLAETPASYPVSNAVNDTRFGEQWSLKAIDIQKAWNELPQNAAEVKVAVIDSGICSNHAELDGKVLIGYNFINNSTDATDDNGHGCEVSGIIAAKINNNLGIAGIASNAKIIPLKVLDNNGIGSYSNVAAAIVFAADNGAQVINLSLGGSNPSTVLENAVNYAKSKNVTIIAAAGNSGTEGALYPAAYEAVMAVGSVDSNLQRSSFSNYGDKVKIYAPGRDILTTSKDGDYKFVSGTSFAAPEVAALSAMKIASGGVLSESPVVVQTSNSESQSSSNTNSDNDAVNSAGTVRFPVDNIAYMKLEPNYNYSDYVGDWFDCNGNPDGAANGYHTGIDIISGLATGTYQVKKIKDDLSSQYDTARSDCRNSTPGTKVYAIADGVVQSVTATGNEGVSVIIKHPSLNNKYSAYFHIDADSSIHAGDSISIGRQLGTIGSFSGTNPHLHFEIRNFPGLTNSQGLDGYSRGSTPSNLGYEDPCQFFLNNGVTTPRACNGNNIVNLVTPQNGRSVTQSFMTFHWEDVRNAEYYQLHIENGRTGEVFFDESLTRSSKVIFNFPLDGTIYKWKVKAILTDGSNGSWSSVWQFMSSTADLCFNPLSIQSIDSIETLSCGTGSSSSSGGGSGNGCTSKPNGLYCGSSLGLDSTILYKCTNGTVDTTGNQSCSFGCNVQPQGTADYCNPNPGGSCPNNKNGKYCGSGLGSQYEQNSLYNCNSGSISKINSCALGCLQKPPGTDDVCKTSTGGGGNACPSNGYFCGNTLGLDPNNLYHCSSGVITLDAQCQFGCQPKDPGIPDACYPQGQGGGGSGEMVRLYQDSNNTGSIRFERGKGEWEDPERGVPYKSMSIPSGWSVILSDQHLGLVGAEQCFNASVSNLETYGGWSTSIESIKIFNTNVCPTPNNDSWVKICKVTGWWSDHPNECITVTDAIPNLGNTSFGNDTVKAINFAGNWEATLYEHDNYNGTQVTLTDNSSDLGGIPIGYGATSIQVRRKQPNAFVLHTMGNRNGGSFESDRSIPDLTKWTKRDENRTWNDYAESLTVQSGNEVILFDNAGFRGESARFTTNQDGLGSLKNKVSSVQVCQGSCPAKPSVPAPISPSEAETFLPGTPVILSWAGNGDEYTVEYSGGSLASPQTVSGIKGQAITKTDFAGSNNPYTWKVKAWTQYGESNWSSTFSFKVQDIAPTQVYVNSDDNISINTDSTFTALVSPSAATNLVYTWAPAPKSGQGTASAVYNWNTLGSQTVSVSVLNTGATVNSSKTINVICPNGKFYGEYFNNKTLTGTPVSILCEDQLNTNWQAGGPVGITAATPNGTGADGNLQVPAGQTIYTDNTRTTIPTSALTGQQSIFVTTTQGFAGGDEVLMIQSQGDGVGTYEFIKISSVNAGNLSITFVSNLINSYIINGTSKVQIIKVPQYQNVTIDGTLTAHPWDGSTGGVLSFKAQGKVTINASGSINLDGKGYRGAAGITSKNNNGKQGESEINASNTASSNNNGSAGGGGGFNSGASRAAGGGAGGYGTAGGDGDQGGASGVTQGKGGVVTGTADLAKLYFGGAGGSGGSSFVGDNQTTGAGGNSGGIAIINAGTVEVNGSLSANGNAGTAPTRDGLGGGGGGAGGSILIKTQVANLGTNKINSKGGIGGPGNGAGPIPGGSAGVGRIRVEYCDGLTGSTTPAASVAQVSCSKDNFSARWTTITNFAAGRYTFTTIADDGIKVWVDGNLIIDKWIDGLNTTSGTLNLTAGNHELRTEYYENTGNAQATLSWAAAVNHAPVVIQIPSQTIMNNATFATINLANYVSDSDAGDSVIWSSSGNTNISVNISNSIATLTFPNGWTGTENITFTATDSFAATGQSTAAFVVNQYAPNTVPTTTQIPNQTVTQGNAFTTIDLKNYATDPDAGEVLTWSVTGNTNIQVTINASSIATLTYPANWTGTENLVFKVTDHTGANATSTAAFKVNPMASANNSLYLIDGSSTSVLANLKTTEGAGQNTDTIASAGNVNYDGTVHSQLAYAITGLNGIYIPADSLKFKIYLDSGTIVGNGSQIKISYDFNGDGTFDRAELYNYFAENPAVDWEEYNETKGMKTAAGSFANMTNGTIKVELWNAIGNGTVDVRTSATSAQGMQSRITIPYNVTNNGTPANNAPITSPIPAQSIGKGQSFATINLANYVTDPDTGDVITWTYSNIASLSISIANSVATVTYPANWTGTENPIFKATDSRGAFATTSTAFTVSNCAPGLFYTEYFNNQTVTGTPVLTQCNASIDNQWNDNSPNGAVFGDHFSGRWTGNINFATAGNYIFTANVDDGERVWVDGNLVIDHWSDHGTATSDVGMISLTTGVHVVKMEYYENTGGAAAKLTWAYSAGCSTQNTFCVTYFNNKTVSGTPALITTATSINNDWGNASPGSGVNADNFSGRWLGNFTFAANTYAFTTTADDGVRLWVDNTLVIDNWVDQGTTSKTVSLTLSAGTHTIKQEYYDSGGGAVNKLTWVGNSAGCTAPGTNTFCVDYYNNKTLSGAQVYTTTETTINHVWNSGGPGNGVNVDNFSGRWTGNFTFTAGNHTFTTTADDGVRLWVDNALVIDNWVDQGTTSKSITLNLTAGTHTVRQEYYENGGGAIDTLTWN